MNRKFPELSKMLLFPTTVFGFREIFRENFREVPVQPPLQNRRREISRNLNSSPQREGGPRQQIAVDPRFAQEHDRIKRREINAPHSCTSRGEPKGQKIFTMGSALVYGRTIVVLGVSSVLLFGNLVFSGYVGNSRSFS